MPGLVNLHTHLPMTLLRGLAENVDLQGFLTRVWAAEGAVMDPETVELGATLGAVESLLGGCTTQLDMYFHHEAAHRGAVRPAAATSSARSSSTAPAPTASPGRSASTTCAPGPRCSTRSAAPSARRGDAARDLHLLPRGPRRGRRPLLRELLAGGDRAGPAVDPRVRERCRERRHPRPVRRDADRAAPPRGWVEPDLPLVVGHGVHLSAGDRDLLAAAGAAVGHCPGSNLKLASGALAWER